MMSNSEDDSFTNYLKVQQGKEYYIFKCPNFDIKPKDNILKLYLSITNGT